MIGLLFKLSLARHILLLLLFLCGTASSFAAIAGPAQAAGFFAPQQQSVHPSKDSGVQAEQKSAYHLPPDKLEKAVHLTRMRHVLHFVSAFWAIGFLRLVLRSKISANLTAWASRRTTRYWLQGFFFLPVLLALLELADLPIGLYYHHLSLIYGLSVQGWGSWFGDWGKSLLLTAVFGTLLLVLLMATIHWSPKRYWLWFWLATIPVLIQTIFVWPVYVEPLFNHFEPLNRSNPELVQQLERVVGRTGIDIPPDRMFLMKASEKWTGLNAYVTGIGKTKRVVVWDTTIQKLPTDDILLIFGHESGHYVLNHIWRGIAGTIALFFVLFLLGSYVVEALIVRNGNRWRVQSLRSWAAIPVFLLTLSILSFFSEPVMNGFSRMQEHDADIYGQEVIHGLVPNPQQTAVDTFQKLGEAYLDDPNPSRWIEFWIYDHPSVTNRANFAASYDPWQPGKSPKYFSK